MQLSFVAIALGLASVVSALPAATVVARQDCVAPEKTVDRFFVANPGSDDEGYTCDQFINTCNDLDGNSAGVRIYNSACEISEQYIIRAECVGNYQDQTFSYTRNVARELGLGLSVNFNGYCEEVIPGKCSQQDFNGAPREVCRYY